MKSKDVKMGRMISQMEGSPAMACNSASTTKLMTSSMTAAVVTSCPVGLESIFIDLKTSMAIPVLVGARTQPTAREVMKLYPSAVDNPRPMAMGTKLPEERERERERKKRN